MILILSEKFDIPTQNIISILKQKNVKYEIIYGSDLLENPFFINIKNSSVNFNNKKYDNIKIVWYRRWINSNFKFSEECDENIYLKNEFEELSSNFMLNIKTDKWLNIPPYIMPYPTKAKQLYIANKIGLKIPETIITNDLDKVKHFYNTKNKKIISKNLSNPLFFIKKNEFYGTYTTSVYERDLENIEKIFFPSIFQNNISKIIEIRAFYFLKKFYCYAIFSSNNKKTNTDYRLYDFEIPNRIMKFNLPKNIEIKIIKFMEFFDLHTGSIDLIYDGKNYFFLEVNPQGQFGGMSDYGLYIEQDIVDYLIKNS